MNEYGKRKEGATVADLGLTNVAAAYWNLTPAELVEETILLGQGQMTDNGALAVDTGEFTGRSPKDRFVVADEKTQPPAYTSSRNSLRRPRSGPHRTPSRLMLVVGMQKSAFDCSASSITVD